ncbi:hypothetical protein GGX14DRAFT_558732 [Mycena pura]|uniref:Uncharacterized protein n=1 Tax=Mycena pura TaxID=153505 RepID=A0AAD7E1S6_9AGAR|nr:hypothetical protein GGX14DRAFT_558732 [Mycena pura]
MLCKNLEGKEGQEGKGCQVPTFHSLGDYHPTVMQFGTSDSYTTQTGELEHRRVKHFYARTNKNHTVRQMSQPEREPDLGPEYGDGFVAEEMEEGYMPF